MEPESDPTEQFRKIIVVTSLVMGMISALIVISEPKGCEGSPGLLLCLVLTASVHIVTFTMLLMHFIGCGKCLSKLGRILGIYYFYMVGVMIYVQMEFFRSKDCATKAPMFYFWIALQILIFYILVAYAIALMGAYLCWQAEKEDDEIKQVIKFVMEKQAKQALLDKYSVNKV